MTKSHLTNEQMTELLKDLQKFWKKWRDTKIETEYQWNDIVDEANRMYRKAGESSADLIAAFINQVHLRNIEFLPEGKDDI